jgi:hypothetical protein
MGLRPPTRVGDQGRGPVFQHRSPAASSGASRHHHHTERRRLAEGPGASPTLCGRAGPAGVWSAGSARRRARARRSGRPGCEVALGTSAPCSPSPPAQRHARRLDADSCRLCSRQLAPEAAAALRPTPVDVGLLLVEAGTPAVVDEGTGRQTNLAKFADGQSTVRTSSLVLNHMFEYGSGGLPPGPRAPSERERPPGAILSSAGHRRQPWIPRTSRTHSRIPHLNPDTTPPTTPATPGRPCHLRYFRSVRRCASGPRPARRPAGCAARRGARPGPAPGQP